MLFLLFFTVFYSVFEIFLHESVKIPRDTRIELIIMCFTVFLKCHTMDFNNVSYFLVKTTELPESLLFFRSKNVKNDKRIAFCGISFKKLCKNRSIFDNY